MSTCNRLDLQTLGYQPVMPKYLPDHCPYLSSGLVRHSSNNLLIDCMFCDLLTYQVLVESHHGDERGLSRPMNGENQPLVIDEPDEFQK